jgi:hypothetical protein
VFSLLWARLRARPRVLHAWLADVQQGLDAGKARQAPPELLTGCEDGAKRVFTSYAQPKVRSATESSRDLS